MRNLLQVYCSLLFNRDRLRIPAVFVLFCLFSTGVLQGAGWSFTVEVRVSGSDCGSYNHKIPYPNMGIPTKAQCELVREYVSSIKYYDIGCTSYVYCGPCTGSDILTPGSSGTGALGEVSIDGLLVGRPLFNENSSTVISNWINEYKFRMQAMGLSPEIDLQSDKMSLPTTGDNAFDKLYSDQIVGFEKSGYAPVDLSGKQDFIGSTPMLLTTDEDIRKQDEWIKRNGLTANMRQMGADNTIPSDDEDGADDGNDVDDGSGADNSKSQADRNYDDFKQLNETMLFAIGNMPGGTLPAEIGGFVNKLSENTFENLDNAVKSIVGTGSADAVLDERGILVKTVTDVAVDKAKDFAKGMVVTKGRVGDALDAGGVVTYVENSAKWIYKSVTGK